MGKVRLEDGEISVTKLPVSNVRLISVLARIWRRSEGCFVNPPEECHSRLPTLALVPQPGQDETTGDRGRIIQDPLHLRREEKAH